MLSKRLKTISSLIPKKVRVIDVGCDHALLDIYLTLNNENECVASDINENAISGAIKNIKKYNLENKISVVISDGIENIEIKKNDYIVIAGMGTSTILKIIENKQNQINNLIISSHNEHEFLRKELVKKGFYIEDEIIEFERGKYYLIIKLNKKKMKYKKMDYYLGPILKQKQELQIKKYYENLYNTNKLILEKIPNKYILKRINLKKYNKWIKKVLDFS